MQVFSATSAISPAIDRTKNFLFRNIRFGTFLKLCLVAVITEGGGSSFHFPSRHHSHASGVASLVPFAPPDGFHLTPAIFVLILTAATLAIAAALIISYLVTRLRFAYFHCLIRGTREIGPGWRLYDDQSWRFFLLQLAVSAAFLVLVLLVSVPFVLGFFRFIRESSGRAFDIAGFLALVLPLIPVIVLLGLLAAAMEIVLRDFMLPHYALENATVCSAWGAVCRRIAAEKGAFFLYALLRIALPLAAGVAAFMVLFIFALLLGGLGFLLVHGAGGFIANAWGLHSFFPILLKVVLVTFGVAMAALVILVIGGPIGTWARTYALLFYGGRYQPLGDVLDPPPARPAIETPPLPA